jgi:hypothetical protein
MGARAKFFGGLMIVATTYMIPTLLAYLVVRFGVKHGMLSYYNMPRRKPDPAEESDDTDG